MNDTEIRVTVPIQWHKLPLPVIQVLIFSPWNIFVLSNPKRLDVAIIVFMLIETVFFLIPGILAVIEYLTQYSYGPEGITVRFLGVRIRQVPWSRVGHAIYAFAWRDPGYPYFSWYRYMPHMGQIIYVTLAPRRGFLPEADIRWMHRLLRPFTSFCMFLPSINVPHYTMSFQHYYPRLKRQTQESARTLGANRYDERFY